MKPISIALSLVTCALISACGVSAKTNALTNAAGSTVMTTRQAPPKGRVIFRCTTKATGSYEVLEKDGKVSFRGGVFMSLPVKKFVDAEGDVRTYSFVGANIIDGVAHNLNLHIGTDNNPDSISTDGDVFPCKWKATVNTVILDELAQRPERMVKAIIAQAPALKLCEGDRDNDRGFGMSFGEIKLNSEEWLVPVYCSMAAYQGTYQLVRWNERLATGKVVQVETLDEDLKTVVLSQDLMGTPGLDRTTGQLTNFAKSRGIGDCGIVSKYKALQGDVLPLKEVRAKFECDGVFVDPFAWPLVYSAR